ncbi:DNA polymerase III subunit delta [Quisquiliibacterium transsilvanicum]|uniref:DNA polymerase III subunit delta n=1 Tax=Quisquiliibacterium transsilvanicum TaxID=1549638 RepID=A0A7W8M7N1_9BURK|nr:DNA polymerase-3 subunit delta [Quisquiliibacterium transsilvanicum]
MAQVRPEALSATLARRIPALVWIHGDEPLLVIESTDLARRAMREAGFQERQVFDVDRSFRVEALVAETRSLSLFASSRIIELRLSGKPGKELGQALAEAAADADEGTRLLVSGPRLDRTATSAAWFTELDRAACVVPIFPVERAQLPKWIAHRLAAARQRADEATLAFLAERVEGNLLAAHQELRKLALLFPEGLLPAEEVRQAVLNVARYDAFSLADAMLAGDAARTLRSVDGLRAEGEAAPLALWAISDPIRNLARLADGSGQGRPLTQRMRELRIFGPRERLYERALGRLDARALAVALQEAARIDRIIKGLVADDAWAAMARLAASIAGAPALARPPDPLLS